MARAPRPSVKRPDKEKPSDGNATPPVPTIKLPPPTKKTSSAGAAASSSSTPAVPTPSAPFTYTLPVPTSFPPVPFNIKDLAPLVSRIYDRVPYDYETVPRGRPMVNPEPRQGIPSADLRSLTELYGERRRDHPNDKMQDVEYLDRRVIPQARYHSHNACAMLPAVGDQKEYRLGLSSKHKTWEEEKQPFITMRVLPIVNRGNRTCLEVKVVSVWGPYSEDTHTVYWRYHAGNLKSFASIVHCPAASKNADKVDKELRDAIEKEFDIHPASEQFPGNFCLYFNDDNVQHPQRAYLMRVTWDGPPEVEHLAHPDTIRGPHKNILLRLRNVILRDAGSLSFIMETYSIEAELAKIGPSIDEQIKCDAYGYYLPTGLQKKSNLYLQASEHRPAIDLPRTEQGKNFVSDSQDREIGRLMAMAIHNDDDNNSRRDRDLNGAMHIIGIKKGSPKVYLGLLELSENSPEVRLSGTVHVFFEGWGKCFWIGQVMEAHVSGSSHVQYPVLLKRPKEQPSEEDLREDPSADTKWAKAEDPQDEIRPVFWIEQADSPHHWRALVQKHEPMPVEIVTQWSRTDLKRQYMGIGRFIHPHSMAHRNAKRLKELCNMDLTDLAIARPEMHPLDLKTAVEDVCNLFPYNKEQKAFIVEFAQNPQQTRYLVGPAGTGKTYTMIAIIILVHLMDLKEYDATRPSMFCSNSNRQMDAALKTFVKELTRPDVQALFTKHGKRLPMIVRLFAKPAEKAILLNQSQTYRDSYKGLPYFDDPDAKPEVKDPNDISPDDDNVPNQDQQQTPPKPHPDDALDGIAIEPDVDTPSKFAESLANAVYKEGRQNQFGTFDKRVTQIEWSLPKAILARMGVTPSPYAWTFGSDIPDWKIQFDSGWAHITTKKWDDIPSEIRSSFSKALIEVRLRVLQACGLIVNSLSLGGCPYVAGYVEGDADTTDRGSTMLNLGVLMVDEGFRVTPLQYVSLVSAYPEAEVIVLGDPRQNGPVTTSPYNPYQEQEQQSYAMRTLKDHPNVHRLIWQNRAHPDIADPITSKFYDKGEFMTASGTLENDPQWAAFQDWTSTMTGGTYKGSVLSTVIPKKLSWVNQITANPSRINPPSSAVSTWLAKSLIDTGKFTAKDIGIISPYYLQAQEGLRNAETCEGLKDPQDLEYGTIDGIQGNEYRVVFIDTTITTRVGFLKSALRMVTALSRAKVGIVFVMSEESLAAFGKQGKVAELIQELHKMVSEKQGLMLTPKMVSDARDLHLEQFDSAYDQARTLKEHLGKDDEIEQQFAIELDQLDPSDYIKVRYAQFLGGDVSDHDSVNTILSRELHHLHIVDRVKKAKAFAKNAFLDHIPNHQFDRDDVFAEALELNDLADKIHRKEKEIEAAKIAATAAGCDDAVVDGN